MLRGFPVCENGGTACERGPCGSRVYCQRDTGSDKEPYA